MLEICITNIINICYKFHKYTCVFNFLRNEESLIANKPNFSVLEETFKFIFLKIKVFYRVESSSCRLFIVVPPSFHRRNSKSAEFKNIFDKLRDLIVSKHSTRFMRQLYFLTTIFETIYIVHRLVKRVRIVTLTRNTFRISVHTLIMIDGRVDYTWRTQEGKQGGRIRWTIR